MTSCAGTSGPTPDVGTAGNVYQFCPCGNGFLSARGGKFTEVNAPGTVGSKAFKTYWLARGTAIPSTSPPASNGDAASFLTGSVLRSSHTSSCSPCALQPSFLLSQQERVSSVCCFHLKCFQTPGFFGAYRITRGWGGGGG